MKGKASFQEEFGVTELDKAQANEISGGIHWILVGLIWYAVGETINGIYDGITRPCH